MGKLLSGSRLLDLKEMKNSGVKIVGYIPNGYMPEELVHACGAVPVALIRGGDPEPVAISASYLGTFIDTFCRAQIGYRVLKEEPLYQMLDLLIVPVTDNHVRAIADSWDFYIDVALFRLGVPHAKTDHGYKYYLQEINLLKEQLERLTGTKITKQRLREEIDMANRMRRLLKEISLMRRSEHPPISGKDFIKLNHDSFYADRHTTIKVLESLCDELKVKDAPSLGGPRVLLTGSTLAVGDSKVVDLLEEAGASIVIEEFCEGMRNYWQIVDANDDPMQALANSYFARRVPCAFFRGAAKERFDFLLRLINDFKVDGVVWYSLMYRDSYDIEGYLFRRALEKLNIPMLRLSSDYDAAETGTFRTRIETFIDTIKKR
jgi:benzoyl-CoA reductase/2-hydroxyglutaryl-CoA dehydratase subunit BcrC/BadD/HgdB